MTDEGTTSPKRPHTWPSSTPRSAIRCIPTDLSSGHFPGLCCPVCLSSWGVWLVCYWGASPLCLPACTPAVWRIGLSAGAYPCRPLPPPSCVSLFWTFWSFCSRSPWWALCWRRASLWGFWSGSAAPSHCWWCCPQRRSVHGCRASVASAHTSRRLSPGNRSKPRLTQSSAAGPGNLEKVPVGTTPVSAPETGEQENKRLPTASLLSLVPERGTVGTSPYAQLHIVTSQLNEQVLAPGPLRPGTVMGQPGREATAGSQNRPGYFMGTSQHRLSVWIETTWQKGKCPVSQLAKTMRLPECKISRKYHQHELWQDTRSPLCAEWYLKFMARGHPWAMWLV